MGEKIYHMYNPDTNVSITCTEKFVLEWLARGFIVEGITEEDSLESSRFLTP